MPSITLVVVLSALVPGGATEWRSGSRRRCADGSSDVAHEARRLDDECPRTRGCNSPQPYSTMSLDESSPTYFSSAGFPPDLEAAVARGVDLAAGFLGRVGPVPVVMMELEKDAAAYSSMTAAVKAWQGFGFDIQEEVDDAMDRTCQGREEDHCQDQCSWDDDDEICRKNEAYYASSRSSCMCGGYAIEYVPLFFAIHGDKETPKNIQQRAIHEYAHAFQFSRGGVWANFLVEGGAVLLGFDGRAALRPRPPAGEDHRQGQGDDGREILRQGLRPGLARPEQVRQRVRRRRGPRAPRAHVPPPDGAPGHGECDRLGGGSCRVRRACLSG